MVHVEWKRKPKPDLPRTESELPREGSGLVVSCPTCGTSRTVYRGEIMSGDV
jgi:hypothetical protein